MANGAPEVHWQALAVTDVCADGNEEGRFSLYSLQAGCKYRELCTLAHIHALDIVQTYFFQ